MIISIEDKFDNLYNTFVNAGYDVHKFSEKIISDVVIYSGTITSITAINSSTLVDKEGGIFLVNGDNKSSLEIDEIIKSRSYSSIF